MFDDSHFWHFYFVSLFDIFSKGHTGTSSWVIEFGSPSGAASNLGLTIVTLADFSDYDYYYYYDGDVLYNYNGQELFYDYHCLFFIKVFSV